MGEGRGRGRDWGGNGEGVENGNARKIAPKRNRFGV